MSVIKDAALNWVVNNRDAVAEGAGTVLGALLDENQRKELKSNARQVVKVGLQNAGERAVAMGTNGLIELLRSAFGDNKPQGPMG